GFPVPRTEQLVAAGGYGALVAAGVVTQPSLLSAAEVEALVAAAAERIVDARFAAERRRAAVVERVAAITAAARVDRRARAIAKVQRALTAAAAFDPSKHKRSPIGRFTNKFGDEITVVKDLTDDPDRPGKRKATYRAQIDGDSIGELSADHDSGLILSVDTPEEYRGEGIARGLYETANDTDGLYHVPAWGRTEDGNQFVDSVGGDVMDDEDALDALGLDAQQADHIRDMIASSASPYAWIVAAGGRRVRTQEGAARFGVSVGDLIPEAVAQAQQMGGKFAEAAGNDVANLIDPNRKKSAPKPGGKESKAVDAPNADAPKSGGKTDAASKNDGGPAADKAPAKSSTAPAAKSQAKTGEKANVDDSKAKATKSDAVTTPASSDAKPDNTQAATAPAKSTLTPALAEVKVKDAAAGQATASDTTPADSSAAPNVVDYSNGSSEVDYIAQHPNRDAAVITSDVPPRLSGTTELMLEDEAPETGANGGQLVAYKDGVAQYDDDTETDGTNWYSISALAPTDDYTGPDSGQSTSFTAEDGLDPNVDDFGEPAAGEPITDTTVPPRIDAGAGTDHPMLEDESPMTGAYGGQLTDYSDGVAAYDDGSQTDGTTWTYTGEPTAPQDELTASAHERAMRRIFGEAYRPKG
ncbi:MAG: hypothetical protein QM582_19010, partial [Micropruina sp.]|uniref:hypothetical protein n=1 Tax=Micropruina sp. TaxID=2737536 RepID=UPI0039E3FFED